MREVMSCSVAAVGTGASRGGGVVMGRMVARRVGSESRRDFEHPDGERRERLTSRIKLCLLCVVVWA